MHHPNFTPDADGILFGMTWLHDCSLEDALRGAVERKVVTTAMVLLFLSKMNWVGERNLELID